MGIISYEIFIAEMAPFTNYLHLSYACTTFVSGYGIIWGADFKYDGSFTYKSWFHNFGATIYTV